MGFNSNITIVIDNSIKNNTVKKYSFLQLVSSKIVLFLYNSLHSK